MPSTAARATPSIEGRVSVPPSVPVRRPQDPGANATENKTLLRTLVGPGGTGYDRCLHVSIVARMLFCRTRRLSTSQGFCA